MSGAYHHHLKSIMEGKGLIVNNIVIVVVVLKLILFIDVRIKQVNSKIVRNNKFVEYSNYSYYRFVGVSLYDQIVKSNHLTRLGNGLIIFLSLIDTFIEQIFHIRKTLLGVGVSALIMAPIAIGLSVYLLRHPSFLAVLEIENDFGIVLSVLLGTILLSLLYGL
jgi:hypothetical protein